jgi:Cu/Ag efflux protein CusF
MKRKLAVVGLTLAAVIGGTSPVFATSHASPGAMAEEQGTGSEGEIRKVDKEAKKITIRHGAISNLDMPPMTMVFRVSDATMLDNVKAGDKVRFSADKVDGTYVVMKIETVR